MTVERTMLITGASRGIGAATARMAAREGWAVGVNYRTEREAAEAIVAGIEAEGGTAAALHADLGTEAGVLGMFEAADRLLPPLGCLVNNAARTAPRRMRLSEMSWDEIASLLAVNVTGAMIASREAAARLSTASGGAGGSIVNVSSLAAKHGAAALYVHYGASKGALDTFTWGLARELAAEGVRVNGVRPGMIDTEIHARAGMPDRVEQRGPRLPMGRAGTPDEVAAAIIWLASDAASYVTGSILDVGGGA
ncbi:SDR family oxidoreductase [Pikeienuella piscinae]|uniref:SDR family oxidoreductase n=1 Tax=Pikeienuella piscinae TaxID=2748098 RepID=A0A7L5BVE3_9RHOB|nr:SDR family oxidoreductase [Pikeienuella piscinae]QIE55053.1 SDR family oxidoreductase [Pikeienuella piscinae]